MNEIMCLIDCYLKLKDDYKEYHKEKLHEVFFIFAYEVRELNDEVDYILNTIYRKSMQGHKELEVIGGILEDQEENLVNEIADVIFTCSRLIKEFNLQEPLIEMMEYKYHRQCIREEKKKDERFR